jgi:hypothetical protein
MGRHSTPGAWWYLVPVGLFAAAHTVHGLLSLGLV